MTPKSRFMTPALASTAAFSGLLAAWQVVCALGIWPPQILVSPVDVARTLLDLARSGELERHLCASLFRLVTGFSIGATAGLATGIAIALSVWIERAVAPLFHVARQVPVIAFIPLLILFFDVEDSFKIVVVAFAAFFPVALATIDGIRAVPPSYREVARLYRLPAAALIARVILPATVPAVLTGIRLGLTRAWLALVAAELLAADSGLGQMMEMGRQMFRIDLVMAGVVVTGVIGYLLDRTAIAAENHFTRWSRA